ncbi:ATP-binding cassette domain-containing protein [Clostridium beijerinckii]|uniref:ABC transporter ATP-binding protein/permease n=1 Tax=Clostridium beijerinckii TaxID=1520 RepID=UPI001360F972|nr:ABC transporter ATP-binding protein/permease [Clostridium beijerinckii]MZK50669.1 ATP-binding cassette domain-containing protein [Clostridium beijerinckii]MZK58873.1 ATP-binding cassette domain-containing protein [Clostridium beijerinckii]MZK68992.1 ATP-binding cassette domain-containing protein [Clostridium beijerinckii]MZK74364.1 ATP-binding cassette domain-containing protein [Clostridium beijerinckii]MZK84064.1 ATP-binding cassette domain-containing protein [Clostridium beijerinckii]
MSVLSLKNISKYYKVKNSEKIYVLKDINLSFGKNELVAIIGESGSGKSTLMNLIGGLDSKYSGELFVNGENIKKFKKRELDEYRKNKIGFVFQSFNLIPHLSVLNNVAIAMTLSNIKKKERVKRAKELLIELGLKEHINKKPNQLSGGQKQRVAIARALINDPEIIIADEPTGSLDSKTSMQVLEIMKSIAKAGKLVIMVTHSEKVASCCSRVIKIADGSITDDKFFEFEDTADNEKSYEGSRCIKKRGKSLNSFNAIKLALTNMKEKAIRNIAISIGSSIGIMSLILMLAFGNGIKAYFNRTMNSYVNPLVIEVNMPSDDSETVDLDIATIQKPDINKQTPFKEDDIKKLSEIENVSSIEKGFNEISLGADSLSYNGKGSNVMRLSTISSNITESNLKEGTLPKDGEILINKTISDKVGEDVIGKKVTLSILVNQKVLKKEFVVSGIYTTAGGDLTSIMKSVFLNYSDLENWYSENKYELKSNVMYLNTPSEKYTDGIKEKVKELGYSGSSQEQMLNMFNSMISILTYVLSGISAVSLVVSAIMIVVIMYISVVERTKEIGIIKAIGGRRKDIRKIFVLEAFLIGCFSGIIGLAFAYALMRGINIKSIKLFGINLVLIKKSYAAFGLTLSIVISVLAGLLPANKAARLDPVESLRRE